MRYKPLRNNNSKYKKIVSAMKEVNVPQPSEQLWSRIEQSIQERKQPESTGNFLLNIFPAVPRTALAAASVVLLVTLSSLAVHREQVMYKQANGYLNDLVSYTQIDNQLIDDEILLLGTF